MTKCTFMKYGSSGTIQKHDALCLLAWNIFNEKVYIFLWFWLIILSVLTVMALLFRTAVIFSPLVRLRLLRRQSDASATSTEIVVRRVPFGDYFLLMLLSKNLEGFLFNGLVDDLASRFTTTTQSKTNSLSKDSSNLEMAPILTNFPNVDR